MKKLLSILLCLVLVFSLASLVGCGKKTEAEAANVKLGLGVVSYINNIKNATADAEGSGEVVNTAAAVLVDADGKIVKCFIDCGDYTLKFNNKGEFVKIDSFQSKREKGDAYGMVAYAGAKLEWYAQADAFTSVVEGKTLDEVKKLIADGGKGNDEVVKAGCTIAIADFVAAIEKAVANAKDSKATADDTLNIAIVSAQSGENAAADKAGNNKVDTTISAVAVNKDKKVTASVTDAFEASISFDAKGAAAVSDKVAIETKREKGDNYGMVAYAGAKLEWYAHVDAFDAAVIGKTSSEIAELVTAEGKGTDAIVKAGCTIAISDIVKAAAKAAK